MSPIFAFCPLTVAVLVGGTVVFATVVVVGLVVVVGALVVVVGFIVVVVVVSAGCAASCGSWA